MTFTVLSGATVTQLLELGSRSLLYFEHFGPRFERWAKRVPENGDYATLHRRFYEQNGLSEEAIRATADTLREVLGALRTEYQAQGDHTRAIAGVWQGSAASAAITLLNRQLALAEADIAALTRISADFDRLPELLRTAVRGKAEIVLQILEHGTELKIDGKTPEDVDLIIDGADGFGWTHTLSAGSAASRAQALFPDVRLGVWEEFVFGGPGAVQSPWSPYQDVIAERCRSWLDELFVPDYERKARWFGEICAVADGGVRDAYAGVVGKFGGLTGEKYPRPGAVASETPVVPSAPVETVPASTVPAGTESASPTPTSTTPSSTTPSSTTPTSTTPSSTTPTSTTPTSTTPATTTPTSTTPTTTTPTTATPTTTTQSPTAGTPSTSALNAALDGLSTLSSAAQTLTPIAQSVAQSLGTGLSALTDSVTTGIDDALERVQQAFEPVDADGDGQPDDRVLAGFPLGDQRAEVALGADGQLTLTLTGSDGSSAEYRLETDENGHPVLVQVDPETGEKIEPEGESPEEPSPGESEDPPPDDSSAQPRSDADPTDEPVPESPAPADPAPVQPAPAPTEPAPASPTPPDPDPTPANTPGTGTPGAPRREEDGEHRPGEFPDSAPVEPPEPEGDSGARLSEAGPL